jgi:hypothetical protein
MLVKLIVGEIDGCDIYQLRLFSQKQLSLHFIFLKAHLRCFRRLEVAAIAAYGRVWMGRPKLLLS